MPTELEEVGDHLGVGHEFGTTTGGSAGVVSLMLLSCDTHIVSMDSLV